MSQRPISLFVRCLGVSIGLFGVFMCLGLLLTLPYHFTRVSEYPSRIISPILAFLFIGFCIRVGWRSVVQFSPEVVWCIFGVISVFIYSGLLYFISHIFVQSDRVDQILTWLFVSLPFSGAIYHLVSKRTVRSLFPDTAVGATKTVESTGTSTAQ